VAFAVLLGWVCIVTGKRKENKTMKSKGITAKGINWPRGWRPSEDADWILVKP